MARMRWRVSAERKEVIAKGEAGTIRYALEASGSALALFSTRDRKLVIAESMQDGGDYYLAIILPKSFTDYADKKGYTCQARYNDRKLKLTGQALPLVGFTGDLIKDALTNAKAIGRGGENPSVTLVIPTGPHRLPAIVQVVLKTVLPEEVEEIARVVDQSLRATITGADYSIPDRAKLTPPQRFTAQHRSERSRVSYAPQRASGGG